MDVTQEEARNQNHALWPQQVRRWKGDWIFFICNPETIRNCKDLEKDLGLKVTRLFIAVKANPDWVIPSTRRNCSAVMWALVTESLAAGPTVVLGEFDTEFLPAVVAVQDFMVWYPVCRSGCIFYQTCGWREVGKVREKEKKIICEHKHVKNALQRKHSHTASHNTATAGKKTYW